jgi:CRISPR-associated protein Csm1
MNQQTYSVALAAVLGKPDAAHGLLDVVWDALPDGLRAVARQIWAQEEGLLSGVERMVDASDPGQPRPAFLRSVLASTDLGEPLLPPRFHNLEPLAIGELIYPQTKPHGNAAGLSAGLRAELAAWKANEAHWDSLPVDHFLFTLLALLRKYAWCLPASAAQPDVSLYEQRRLISALAACLAGEHALPAKPGAPVALLVRGGLSGIQNFIYRITRPESDTAHVSKRLRGRSFYVGLLSEVLSGWILEQAGMPPHAALFVGGGRFDLLLPVGQLDELQKLAADIDRFLLENFQGELSCVVATRPLSAADLQDMRAAYGDLDARMALGKKQKWASQFVPDFFCPPDPTWHACPVCQLSATPNGETCDLCLLHEKIGQHLPASTHLAFMTGSGALPVAAERCLTFRCGALTTQVALIREPAEIRSLATLHRKGRLYRINQTSDFIAAGIPSAYRFLANSAACALAPIVLADGERVEKDEILPFEVLAQLSGGAARLGILKADVDHLGLLTSEGLSAPQIAGGVPALGRLATLSGALDLFFAGELKRLCELVSDEYKAADPDKMKSVTGLFYVVYSGGDDLFIIGPWDAIIRLAQRIRAEFGRYAGDNPNVTLSAGIVQVKPRYPVQKFAELVDEAEKQAKSGGRNRVTLFAQTVTWGEEAGGLVSLLRLADRLTDRIAAHKIPRGLIFDLGEIQRQHQATRKGSHASALWTPRVFYTLTRRLDPDVRAEIGGDILSAMGTGHIMVPVSIVSLSLREE